MGRTAKSLYYGIQRLRCGVNRDQVKRAVELLESPWIEIDEYVERRLKKNYEVEASEGISWLTNQPITDKDVYRRRGMDQGLLTRIKSERRRTSGSSGKPFTFRRDRRMAAWMDAAMWAVYKWYGVEPGDRMARFWGRPVTGIDRLKRRVADRLLRQRRMSAFDVCRDRSEAFYSDLLSWGPTFAYGYPTLIREFIEHLKGAGKDGQALDLNVVITTGEVLSDSVRQTIQNFFGCPVANEYGCSEGGILSFECKAGFPHFIPVATYAEVLDESTDTSGVREGPVVITDLYGDVRPFVRYRLNDVARLYPPSECECGRQLPRLEPIAAREGGFIRTPKGQKIYGAVLAYTVPQGVAQFQVRQTRVDQLIGAIVVAEGSDDGIVLEECHQRWSKVLGPEVEIELDVVDGIDRGSSGKLRYFIPLEKAS